MGKTPQSKNTGSAAQTPGRGKPQEPDAASPSDPERANPNSGHVETGPEAIEHGERFEPGSPGKKGAKPGR